VRAAGLRIPLTAYEAGIVNADWPARLQRLSQGKLPAMAPAGSELWLDGGHNPGGALAVSAALGDLEERVSRPLVLIVGMLSTKDCEGFLRNFAGLTRRLFAIPVPGQHNGTPPDKIADIARKVGIPAQSRENITEALAATGRLGLDPAPRILITGTLYLAGEVLALNGTPPE
jgi:dihydrofolate synthase/folylpolyglutamate synthase